MENVNRRGKSEAKAMRGDVESQATDPSEPETPRTRLATAHTTSPGSSPLAVLLRKFLLLTSRDVSDNPQGNYLITMMKDVISGTLLGVFFLMILVFLDYHNVVQLGSARAFRSAAFEMTDPETVRTIEESIDVKFVPLEVYQSMQEETSWNKERVKEQTGLAVLALAAHEKDWKEKTAELDVIQPKHTALKATAEKTLGLDKWCGHCKAGWGNCNVRVGYLKDTYHTSEMRSKLDIMKTGRCVLE